MARRTTGVIRYNLNDTGRAYTGQPRKLDIDAAMRLFNGPQVQESIRKGDIVGYVGHQFREKYGLDVPETVIEGGRAVVLEPAVRTVMARCLPDGTLEHEQEFLDTAGGRIAARLWDSKAFGFSSAIYAPEQNGVRVPLNYFGMDFVRAPNYDGNRGYSTMLDSVGPGCFAASDMFVTDNAALLDSVDAMIRASDEQAEQISEAYLRACAQNDELVELNARLMEKLRAKGGEMLDSAAGADNGTMTRPLVMDKGASMMDSAKLFMSADLPTFEEPKKETSAPESGAMEKALGLVGTIFRGIGV